ncbi:hypothetical protein [Hydrogenophaga sp.]|uniref:hypothetical protein n=1 Tax=Hydrogenophaga sp. TaxID=1904254 RepID=UPI002724E65E|nr:hypothetical protein [Hydrogenophaga sp.]MDO9434318.1 hypothetical protein [Hydrogenophaga sp.]
MKRSTMEAAQPAPPPRVVRPIPLYPPSATARRCAEGGGLESLAEPVVGPQGETRPLAQVLRAYVEQLRLAGDPQADAQQAAVDAILLLDQHHHTGGADKNTCQSAAELLLQTKQGRLLCRLAEVTGFVFWLNIDANRQAAEVLARCASWWPPGVGASLVLNTTMPSALMDTLHPFLVRPSSLNVHVIANAGTESPHAAFVFARAVKQRPLAELSILSSIMSVDVLRSMTGVVAQAVCIHDDSLNRTYDDYLASLDAAADLHGDSQVETPDAFTALFDATRSALEVLVRCSGATTLDVAGELVDSSMSPAIALTLLGCRDHWDQVQVTAFTSADTWELLGSARTTIGRLDIVGWTHGGSVKPLDVLRWAERYRVHTIVFHDEMNLVSFAQSLERYLLTSSHVFDRIEACFFTKEHNEPRRSVALAAVLNNPIVVTVTHRPSARAPLKPTHLLMGPADAARLDEKGASHRLLPMEERSRHVQRVAEQRKTEVAEILAGFLDAGRETAELVAYMDSPSHILLPPSLAFESEVNAFGSPLAQKLKLLQLCSVDTDFIKAAVTRFVSADPSEISAMCAALIRIGFGRAHRSEAEWRALGQRFAGANAGNASRPSTSESRRRWQTELERLIQLFSIQESKLFARTLGHAATRAARTTEPQAPSVAVRVAKCDTALRKVRVMKREGVPRAVIGQAIGRVWRAAPQVNPELLEALAYVGVVPAAVWLNEGLGIDIQAPALGTGSST